VARDKMSQLAKICPVYTENQFQKKKP